MASTVEVAGVGPRSRRARAVEPRTRRRSGFLGGHLQGTPWSQRDLVRLVLWQVLGAIGIVITWFGSSGEVVFRDQVIWTAFAVLAAALAAVGGAGWLLTGLGAVARERRALRQDIADCYGFTGRVSAPSESAEPATARVVTAAGMRRYHLPSCDVVRGKTTRPALVPGPDAENLQPCGMCQP